MTELERIIHLLENENFPASKGKILFPRIVADADIDSLLKLVAAIQTRILKLIRTNSITELEMWRPLLSEIRFIVKLTNDNLVINVKLLVLQELIETCLKESHKVG